MPLQNRVDPFGELFVTPARGTLMGNRGGRFHRDDRTLSTRRFASRRWICCRLSFKGRHRTVWGDGYTELFFLDEVTALAAGHRPCFECRRSDAETFARLWGEAHGLARTPSADEMDAQLDRERRNGRRKRTHARAIDRLPDGAMVVRDGKAFAVHGRVLLPWTPLGYGTPVLRPETLATEVLTPPGTLAVLARGYVPLWRHRREPWPGTEPGASRCPPA